MCIETVYSFCRSLVKPGDRVLAAVSGGADSTALAHLLAALRERLGIAAVGIAHVNHGLRGAESDGEEAFVRRLAGDLGCAFHLKRLSGLALDSAGIEERAREERYAFFRACMRERGYRYVATGHTADDQAETVLMRILRGTGLAGLAGIRPVRGDGVIRPLLSLRRSELVEWLTGRGIPYCEDSSNSDGRFTRNWIRSEVMPVLVRREPRAVEHLAACAEHARRWLDELAPKIDTWIGRHVLSDDNGRFVLRKWSGRGAAMIAQEAVAELFRKHGIPFDRKHVDYFLREIRRTNGEFLLPAGWRFFPKRSTVEIRSASRCLDAPAPFCFRIEIPGTTTCEQAGCRFTAVIGKRRSIALAYHRSNTTAYLDAKVTGKTLVYRSIKAGDEFQQLGADRPCNATHFLKAHKAENRGSVGVVAKTSGEIVWIPACAVGQKFRVTGSTREILKISYCALD